jgi:hypothetical protein
VDESNIKLDDPRFTLEQLRDAAYEAGISSAAFDAAVAEWRRSLLPPAPPLGARFTFEGILPNVASIAAGWLSVTLLATVVRVAAAPWLIHKLSDPVGLALGALIAAKLRARTATILLGGLAVSQAAEFVMDLMTGAPAIRGFGAHMALIIAGVAGAALGLRRPAGGGGSSDTTDGPTSESVADAEVNSSRSRRGGLANTDKRCIEMLRLVQTRM